MSTHDSISSIQLLAKGELQIGDAVLNCFVIQRPDQVEPERVLSGRAVTKAFGLTGRGPGITRLLDNKRISPKLSEETKIALLNPLVVPQSATGLKPALTINAKVLPELCFGILDANEENPFPANQQKIVIQAKILSRAFATIGIIALVDEATGYQYERQADALALVLQKFIATELAKWVKTFPDEFYKELFRLRGIDVGEFINKRPAYIGRLTNDIVYKRLAPGVLDELQRITPKDIRGRRKHRFFQRLTDDVGHPRLREHLSAVIALMKVSDTYDEFLRMLDMAKPKFTDQYSIALDE